MLGYQQKESTASVASIMENIFFFKQKPAYEIDCDWSSDVCSSDLGEIHIEYADGCVVEHKAPQIVAIEPGHDGWVVGNEPVVLIEFDFEGDTVRRLGMPDAHRHP